MGQRAVARWSRLLVAVALVSLAPWGGGALAQMPPRGPFPPRGGLRGPFPPRDGPQPRGPEALRTTFMALDRNGDRTLDAGEFTPRARAVEEGFAPGGGQPLRRPDFQRYVVDWCVPRLSIHFFFGPATEFPVDRSVFESAGLGEYFPAVDSDGDSLVTMEEWRARGREVGGAMAFPFSLLPALMVDFQAADTSGDERVETAENALLVKFMDADGDGFVTPKEFVHGLMARVGPRGACSWFTPADQNGDQRLGPVEVSSAGLAPGLDRDRDGVVTIIDLLTMEGEAATVIPTPTPPTVAPPVAMVIPTPTPPTVAPPVTVAVAPTPPSPAPAAVPAPTDSGAARAMVVLGLGSLSLLGLGALVVTRRRGSRVSAGPSAAGPEVANKDLLRARGMLRRRAHDKAITLLQPMVQEGSTVAAEASLLLVRAFLAAGSLDAAKAALDRIDLGASELQELYELARAFEKAGSPGTAADLYNRIYARDVTFRDVRQRLTAATPVALTLGGVVSPEAALERLNERYRDPRPIGSGGMGAVFAVYDRVLHRDVAVKLLHASLLGDERLRQRFMREARALARLSHPAIPPVFDLASEPVPYYSMPLLRGRDLAQYRSGDGGGDLSFDRLLTIAQDVTGALAHAHDRGVLHRDVKPANVMVAEEGRAYLVDFGLAQVEDATKVTRTNEMMGTLRYMAPEVFRGGTMNIRTDIYALGLTFFELYTGSHPFGGGPPVSGADPGPVPPVSSLVPGAPVALNAIVARCLAADPEARYASCHEILADLAGLRPRGSAVADGELRVLGLARSLERLYEERLHALKNLVGVVQRFRSQPEKLAGRFFAPATLSRLAELAGPGLVEDMEGLLAEAGDSASGPLAPALSALAAMRKDLAAMGSHVAGLEKAEPEEQRSELCRWHERLTELGGLVVGALRSLDVDLGELVGRAGRSVSSVVRLSVDLGEARSLRCADPAVAGRDLETVFENLFQNAAQAGARRVTVKGALTPNETHVALEVGNDGPGMAASVLDSLFRGGASTKADGTGSGLAACRSVLARYAGTIALASASPVRFVVQLDRGRMGSVTVADEEREGC